MNQSKCVGRARSSGILRPGPRERSRFLCVRPSVAVTPRRREVELSVERPLGPVGSGAGSVRLSVRFDAGDEGTGPSPSDLTRELEALAGDLDALVGRPIAAVPAARADRPLAELVETYRPRQRELVDLLREEGELSAVEHARLVEYLSSLPSVPPRDPVPSGPSETERLIAAIPIDRPLSPADRREPSPAAFVRASSVVDPRPIAELLRLYQISNLRQAGAVRGRRQISYAEYMALKRHFEEAARTAPEGGPA